MAKTTRRKETNEQEFQGQVLSWLNQEIARRPGLGLDRASQEKPRAASGKRNDLVIWRDRGTSNALLAMELKTPTTPINDPVFFTDAIEKAQMWRARYFAVWNMREFELYPTPAAGLTVTPADRLRHDSRSLGITSVEDWLLVSNQDLLKQQAIAILDAASEHAASGKKHGTAIDAEIFVERLRDAIQKLRSIVYRDLPKAAQSSRKLRKRLNSLAAEQGFLGFVEDVDYAISGQIGYRYIGQILFYYALKRKITSLKEIVLEPTHQVPSALKPYWNEVRRYDYEALFGPHPLEDLIPIHADGQFLIRQLIAQLSEYDWASLTDDVLGSVFEHLIPAAEQTLLGQFYTPRYVADLLVAFTVDGEKPLILDPGCGSGTFLMSAYSYLAQTRRLSHADLLSTIWGFDISPFAAELAVINLYRQDMSEYGNFPRIVTGSFLDQSPGKNLQFPAPKYTAGGSLKIDIPTPKFDCILANPPYVRSQHQDDLDPNYRDKLFNAAGQADVNAAQKTDLFAFFIYHALRFLKPGSRIGFVTSASWLTADFASELQRVLLKRMRIVAIITSTAESFFTQVDVNSVLLIAEMKDDVASSDEDVPIRFITLKKPVADLIKGDDEYWTRVNRFVDEIEALSASIEHDRFRAKLVSSSDELSALTSDITRTRNWSKYLRAPLNYYALFGE